MELNKDAIKGKWNELKGSIKAKWAKLTDDDLNEAEGNYDQIKGKLQKLYGYSKERAETEFNDFIGSHKSNVERGARDFSDRAKSGLDKANDKVRQ